tara:strand:+ start:676 stop:1083 length:408 start_codon:yes stop_codon:yes gene_type:complete
MPTFNDTTGETWVVSVTLGTLEDIRERFSVNILDNPGEMPSGIRDMVNLVWVCCEDQANRLGVTPRDFGRRLDGDAIEKAIESFMESYTDFFCRLQPARGEAIREIWKQGKALEERTLQDVKKAFLKSTIASPAL